MLSQILKPICNLTRHWGYSEEQTVTTLYDSWYNMAGAKTDVSQIVSGNRCIPRHCLSWYKDDEHPRCPEPLLQDITMAIEVLCDRPSRWEALRALTDTIVAGLPEPDNAWLRTGCVPSGQSQIEDTAVVLTRLIWYGMVWDTAHWTYARGSQKSS